MGISNIELTTNENLIEKTRFGIITNNRVIFYKKSWLSNEYRQDIPLKQITYVSYENKKSLLIGTLLILLGIILLILIIGIFIIIWGINYIIGYPQIIINTSGNDKIKINIKPKQKSESIIFIKHLRDSLFDN